MQNFKVASLPLGWVLCPPHVRNWIMNIIVPGEKSSTGVVCEKKSVTDALMKKGVPHVAEFVDQQIQQDIVIFKDATPCD